MQSFTLCKSLLLKTLCLDLSLDLGLPVVKL